MSDCCWVLGQVTSGAFALGARLAFHPFCRHMKKSQLSSQVSLSFLNSTTSVVWAGSEAGG